MILLYATLRPSAHTCVHDGLILSDNSFYTYIIRRKRSRKVTDGVLLETQAIDHCQDGWLDYNSSRVSLGPLNSTGPINQSRDVQIPAVGPSFRHFVTLEQFYTRCGEGKLLRWSPTSGSVFDCPYHHISRLANENDAKYFLGASALWWSVLYGRIRRENVAQDPIFMIRTIWDGFILMKLSNKFKETYLVRHIYSDIYRFYTRSHNLRVSICKIP